MWDEYTNNIYAAYKNKTDSSDQMSKVLYLKKYLTVEIANILKKFAEEIKDQQAKHKNHKGKAKKTSELDTNVEVFDIQFAFRNHKLIHLLKQRGTAITNLDFEKMKQCEEQIS